MKPGKIIHLIVAFVLLVSTMGVVINKHYSGGELFSTALFVEAESCCSSSCCHSMPMEGCHEELEYHKLEVDFTIPDNSASLTSSTLDLSLFLINPKFTGEFYSDVKFLGSGGHDSLCIFVLIGGADILSIALVLCCCILFYHGHVEYTFFCDLLVT